MKIMDGMKGMKDSKDSKDSKDGKVGRVLRTRHVLKHHPVPGGPGPPQSAESTGCPCRLAKAAERG